MAKRNTPDDRPGGKLPTVDEFQSFTRRLMFGSRELERRKKLAKERQSTPPTN